MNAFLRQMAVLGILTTLAEHLLPEGGLRKAGRMVMGLLMMLTILTSILSVMKLPLPDIAGLARFQQQAELSMISGPGSYRDTVLESLHRQVQEAAQRAAKDAGYADTAVFAEISDKGEITFVSLRLMTESVPAFAGEEILQGEYQKLKETVARALSLPENLIHVEAGGS
jgi:stage III sporulation protein AF